MSNSLVGRLSADGSTILAATYFGGNGDMYAHPSIVTDAAGNIYLLISTTSTNAPVTPNVLQTTYAGGQWDLLLAKFSNDLSTRLLATYFGGGGNDYSEGFTLFVDARERPCFAVSTTSTNLLRFTSPGLVAFQPQHGGASDVFVGILSSDFRTLVAGTYLGGTGSDREPQGLWQDAAGNVIVTGTAQSPNFPVTYGPASKGASDAFLTVLAPDLASLRMSTLMSGTNNDLARISFLDKVGNLYVAGQTASNDFPTKNPVTLANPSYDGATYRGGTTAGGTGDCFLTKWIR
jgi:hypothetical protein